MNVMDKIFAWLEGVPLKGRRQESSGSGSAASVLCPPVCDDAANSVASVADVSAPAEYDDSEGPMDPYYDEIDGLSNRIDNDTIVQEKAYTAEVEYSTDSSETVSVPPERLGLVQNLSDQAAGKEEFDVLPEEKNDNPNPNP